MKLLIIFFTICMLCISCGVKDDPKYQSKNILYKKIDII